MFTPINDINRKIIDEVDDISLISLCQTSKYIYLESDFLWFQRISLIFPDIPVIKNKNIAKLYHKIKKYSYVKLERFAENNQITSWILWLQLPINQVNLSVERGDHQQLLMYLENGIFPCQKSINMLAKKFGKGDYLKKGSRTEKLKNLADICLTAQLLSDHTLFPTIDVAVKCEDLTAATYLLDIGKRPSQKNVNKIAFAEMLKLLAKYNIYQDIDIAVMHDLEVLEIILEQGKRPTQLTVDSIPSYATLKTLARYNIYQSIDIAIINQHLDLIEDLLKNNEVPNSNTIEHCVKHYLTDVLILLHRYDLWQPDNNIVEDYFQARHYQDLLSLAKTGILIVDYNFINKFVLPTLETGDNKGRIAACIQTIEEYQVYPDQHHVDLCFIKACYPMIDFFLFKQQYPSQNFINQSCQTNDYVMIARLSKYNLFPDQEFIDHAVINNFKHIITVMNKNGKI